ncbi:MAG: cyclic nucleotide-binding domain-containing protein [Armatimonadota bacterium]|nr:cyclic nucleotide-binding domain-containing protein [Armatimonadota bacterium]
MEDLEALLARQPFFRGMDPRWIAFLAGCARNVRFNAGEYLFHEGDEAIRFLLIRHGRVALETHVPGHGPVTIQTIGADDVVGWSWLFPPYRWIFDARAVELVRAVEFEAACIRQKCDQDPAFGYVMLMRLVPVIVSRLQATRLQLLDVYGVVAGRHAHTRA